MAAHGASLTVGNFIIEEGVMGYVKRSVLHWEVRVDCDSYPSSTEASSRGPTSTLAPTQKRQPSIKDIR